MYSSFITSRTYYYSKLYYIMFIIEFLTLALYNITSWYAHSNRCFWYIFSTKLNLNIPFNSNNYRCTHYIYKQKERISNTFNKYCRLFPP